MLAYVFWHWRRAATEREVYEALLREFHSALSSAPPAGLLDVRTFAVAGLPWAAAGGEAYEDWYVVRGSADLDHLEEAAVTAARKVPHDRVAAVAEAGTAGLYRLRLGAPVPDARHAWWFGKPAGVSYADLFAQLKPVCDAGAALWGRQMVLGPSPEFCLQAPGAAPHPATLPLTREGTASTLHLIT